MRKLIILLGCVVIFFFWFSRKFPDSNPPQNTPSPTAVAPVSRKTESVFVPYWGFTQKGLETTTYDAYIYFGIAANEDGIDTKDAGYLQLNNFSMIVPAQGKKLLTLRMLDSDANLAVLKNKQKQQSIISQTLAIASEYNFDGIVLDFELSALPFDSLLQQINVFVREFSSEAKQQKLEFAMTLYGDVFYRLRPFDVKTLSGSVDQFYIMAYDFHKAGGNPGPNFPLSGAEMYGYDYPKLVDGLLALVPPDKITVIFGYFGYDWQVDTKGQATKLGKARTLQEIENTILPECAAFHCEKKRDEKSGEIKIIYTDDTGKQHILWFEDYDSIDNKQSYLRSRGIYSFSSWAWSYFAY